MKRPGMTLMEMVIVIAIVVIVASMAFPLVDAMIHPHAVQAATDHAQAQLSETRTAAMTEGLAMRFSIKENSSEYRIEADDPFFAEQYPAKEGKLRENVLFIRSADTVRDEMAAPSPHSEWTPVVVFQTDGTARDDGFVMVGLPGTAPTKIFVRALTGSATVVDMTLEETP